MTINLVLVNLPYFSHSFEQGSSSKFCSWLIGKNAEKCNESFTFCFSQKGLLILIILSLTVKAFL